MTWPFRSIARRFIRKERGQVLAIVAGGIVALTGMAGLVIDVGFALSIRQALQASTDAAASAGAIEMGLMSPIVANTAIAKARTFGSETGQKNARANMPGVVLTASVVCTNFVSQLMTGANCSGGAPLNTIIVTQTAPVSTFFARVLGFNSLNVTTTSTVAMKGGGMPPLDVMIAIDTTSSMNGSCTGTVPGIANPTRLDCAKAGIRALLTSFWPCAAADGACGAVSAGNVAHPYDKVGLTLFPGLKPTTALSTEFDCATTLTSSDQGPYSSGTSVYNIVPPQTDYKTSAFSALNGGVSNLVKAVSWTDGNSCTTAHYGVEAPSCSGPCTYFANSINQAQSALNASGPNQNVLIFVSDGGGNTYTPTPCQDAITIAQAAATQGTWVYSVAYGAHSGSCTDSGLTPLLTMQRIASSPSRFYDQPTNGDLIAIFQKIGQSLANSRVLENGTP